MATESADTIDYNEIFKLNIEAVRKIEKFGKNDVDDDMQTYSDVSSDKNGEFDNNEHDQRTQSKDAKGKSKSSAQ